MQDPILDKLKTDAGIVLTDLWRAFRHQPAVEDEWIHPRQASAADPAEPVALPEPARPADGLCYFHLN
jgi:hypothetical protein